MDFNASPPHPIHPNTLALLNANIIILWKLVSHSSTKLPCFSVFGLMPSKAPFISLIECLHLFSIMIHVTINYLAISPHILLFESLVVSATLGFDYIKPTNSNLALNHVCILVFLLLIIHSFALILNQIISLCLDMPFSFKKYFLTKSYHILICASLAQPFPNVVSISASLKVASPRSSTQVHKPILSHPCADISIETSPIQCCGTTGAATTIPDPLATVSFSPCHDITLPSQPTDACLSSSPSPFRSPCMITRAKTIFINQKNLFL